MSLEKLREYENFPRAMEAPVGMRELTADKDLPGIAMAGNVVYGVIDGMELRLQILYPIYQGYAEHVREDYPCLIHVHGSAWRAQDVYRRIPSLADLAKKGYVVASVEYRPSATAPFPAQIRDVKAAIRYMRLHAGEYHGNPEKIAVMGDSSGGHTSLMVHLTEGNPFYAPDLYEDISDHVCGCLDLYGPTDLATMEDHPSRLDHLSEESPEGVLMGKRAILSLPEQELKAASAISQIDSEKELPPTLIMHGDKDDSVPFMQSVRLYEALKKAGKDVTFYKVKNAGHGGPEFWTEEILNIYDAFFGRCFQMG